MRTSIVVPSGCVTVRTSRLAGTAAALRARPKVARVTILRCNFIRCVFMVLCVYINIFYYIVLVSFLDMYLRQFLDN